MQACRVAAVAAAAIVPPLVLLSCSKHPSIDWAAPENFFVVEKSERTNEGARMEFHLPAAPYCPSWGPCTPRWPRRHARRSEPVPSPQKWTS